MTPHSLSRRRRLLVRLAILPLLVVTLPLALHAAAPRFPEAPPMEGMVTYTRFFTHPRSSGPDVYYSAANGDDEHAVTSTDDKAVYGGSRGEDTPRWSPDGREIAFSSADNNALVSIWRAPYAGGTPTPVVEDDGAGGYPAWHPSDECIAYSGAHAGGDEKELDLKLWCADTGVETLLNTADFDESDPDWHPDGKTLVYAGRVPPPNLATKSDWSLRVLDVETGSDELMYEIPGLSLRYPRWSPDGERIAFLAGHEMGLGALVVYHVETGTSTAMVGAIGGQRIVASSPTWADDGQTLIFYCTSVLGPYREGDPLPPTPAPGDQRMGLYAIELSTYEISRLRGSAGGSAARDGSYEWGYSPDWTGGTATATPAVTDTPTPTNTSTSTPTPKVTATPTERPWVRINLPITYRGWPEEDPSPTPGEPSPTPDEPSPTPELVSSSGSSTK